LALKQFYIKNVVWQKFRGSSRKFLGAGPVSSKMKTNFKKSGSLFKNLLTYDALRDMKNHSVLEMIMGWSLQDYPTSTRLSIFFKSTSTSLFIGGTFY
jgi:hypothetical protein